MHGRSTEIEMLHSNISLQYQHRGQCMYRYCHQELHYTAIRIKPLISVYSKYTLNTTSTHDEDLSVNNK